MKSVLSAIMILILVSCARSTPKTKINAQETANKHRLINKPSKLAMDIDKVLYSNLSRDQIISKLSIYIEIGDYYQNTRLPSELDEQLVYLTSGPMTSSGPLIRSIDFLNCGIQLVINNDGKVLCIRRKSKNINGIEYREVSISSSIISYQGYTRVYND
jgi:hypothetical protein